METEAVQSVSFYKSAFVFVILGIILYFRKNIVYNSYKKYFAWVFNKIGDKAGLEDEKIRLFQYLHNYKNQQKKDLRILEVGSGTAANLPFYPVNSKVVCLEPNETFDNYTGKNIKEKDNSISVEFVHGYVEGMLFENESFDAVVCTFVLCSVTDMKKCLQEMKRVLRQGGKYIFLEHVAYEDKKSWAWTFQCLINPLHRLLFDGCEANRDIETYIMASGFSNVNVKRFLYKSFPVWNRPCISGLATK